MWTLWFWACLLSVLIGLGAKFGFDYLKIRNDVTTIDEGATFAISWIEFAIVLLVSFVLVIPTTVMVGTKMAKANKLSYHEFWNGYEISAEKEHRPCQRDGNCSEEYDCDPYNHVHEETHYTYDSKGNITGSYVTYYNHTHYHSCPVATYENYYTIKTTLGDHFIGYSFDENPQEWRAGEGGLQRAYHGDLPFWLAAKGRIDRGEPGGVTVDKNYDNYILASTRSILKKYSDAVEKYQKAGMLRDPVHNYKKPIHDYYWADKMQFVDVHVDEKAFNLALTRLNGALGTDLQGDLHVLAIDADYVRNPDEYAGALEAWWQSPKLGKRALSKNGIGLVLGVRDGKIAWVRGFTGMPVGNEGTLLDLQTNLTGLDFTPSIFGTPVPGKDDEIKLTDSPVENALWGAHKFERVCMLCKGKDDKGIGYGYLSSEIQPSSGQKMAIITVAMLFVCLLWGVALLTCIGEKHDGSGRGYMEVGRRTLR